LILEVMAHRGENWSNREIARRCGVSSDLVDRVRPSLPDSGSDTPRTYTDRWGNISTMNTSKIGTRAAGPTFAQNEDTQEDRPTRTGLSPNYFGDDAPPIATGTIFGMCRRYEADHLRNGLSAGNPQIDTPARVGTFG
jgi:hypothetical protein